MKLKDIEEVNRLAASLKEAETFLSTEHLALYGYQVSYRKRISRYGDETGEDIVMNLPRDVVQQAAKNRIMQLKNELREHGVIFPEDEVPLSMG